MSDLRTGLVEAVASAVCDAESGTAGMVPCSSHRGEAEVMLDAALGFLTDKADDLDEAAMAVRRANWGDDYYLARDLIAALSDGRDTGESR